MDMSVYGILGKKILSFDIGPMTNKSAGYD